MTEQCSPETEQTQIIASMIEGNCHRIATIRLHEPRMAECRKLAADILSVGHAQSPLMEATQAQHVGLPKGEPAKFVRNGKLETCQCRDCRDLAQSLPNRDAVAAIINDRTMINDEGFVQNSEAVADAIFMLTAHAPPSPANAAEMLAIADDYEAGLQKMIACGYEEFGPEPQRKHRLIIEALRLAGRFAVSSTIRSPSAAPTGDIPPGECPPPSGAMGLCAEGGAVTSTVQQPVGAAQGDQS